jgi:hypothetical protein
VISGNRAVLTCFRPRAYLTEVTDRVVHEVIHQDSSEAVEVEGPARLEDAAIDA